LIKKLCVNIVFILCSLSAFAGLGVKKIASLPTKLYESSGLIYYKNKYLITHNDGGNKSEIYILNLKGELINTIAVDRAKNIDWEDLAMDKKGKLFIGDFGNNLNQREKCKIYILKKNFEQDENQKINAKQISFVYEDQDEFPPKKKTDLNYDCEAFFWMKDSLYILTKCRSKPFTGVTNIYVLPDKPGNYKARKLGSLQLCSFHWQWCSVTAADYHSPSGTLAVLVYSKLYMISDFPEARFWEGKMKSYNLPGIKQREAICFKTASSFYLTDEFRKGIGGGNLYELNLK
jgi:hypothetical protein